MLGLHFVRPPFHLLGEHLLEYLVSCMPLVPLNLDKTHLCSKVAVRVSMNLVPSVFPSDLRDTSQTSRDFAKMRSEILLDGR